MNIQEFKAWLDGYMEAGGNDLKHIRQKLAEVSDPFQPYYPVKTPYEYPTTVPTPWVLPIGPETTPTPDFTYRIGEVMCGTGAVKWSNGVGGNVTCLI